MLFRLFQHLLPRGIAWRIRDSFTSWEIGDGSSIGDAGLTVGGSDSGPWLSRFFRGVANGLEPYIAFADGVFGDAFPSSTRELAAWESQFGIEANPDNFVRIQNLNAEWAATGGQSPAYINSILAAAGFSNVVVHEWWSSGPPYIARDPHDYTDVPQVGTVECSALSDQPECSALATQPQCNAFLVNDPHYIVNRDLTPSPPPPIPVDPDVYPYFVYFGDPVFPNHATVDINRRGELERLMEKLTPSQQWIVTLIDYTSML